MTYPGVVGTSKVFNDAETELKALSFLLDWAWAEHKKATTMERPFLEEWSELL